MLPGAEKASSSSGQDHDDVSFIFHGQITVSQIERCTTQVEDWIKNKGPTRGAILDKLIHEIVSAETTFPLTGLSKATKTHVVSFLDRKFWFVKAGFLADTLQDSFGDCKACWAHLSEQSTQSWLDHFSSGKCPIIVLQGYMGRYLGEPISNLNSHFCPTVDKYPSEKELSLAVINHSQTKRKKLSCEDVPFIFHGCITTEQILRCRSQLREWRSKACVATRLLLDEITSSLLGHHSTLSLNEVRSATSYHVAMFLDNQHCFVNVKVFYSFALNSQRQCKLCNQIIRGLASLLFLHSCGRCPLIVMQPEMGAYRGEPDPFDEDILLN